MSGDAVSKLIQPHFSSSHRTSWVIGAVCGAFLLVHFFLRWQNGQTMDGIDAISIILLIIGLSPLLANFLSSFEFLGSKVQFKQVQAAVREQGIEIKQLQFLTSNFLPHWEVQHLENLASGKPWIVDLNKTSPSFEGELRHLRSLGFIDHREDVYGRVTIINFFKDNPRTKDVTKYFKITESGRKFLDYRAKSAGPKEAP